MGAAKKDVFVEVPCSVRQHPDDSLEVFYVSDANGQLISFTFTDGHNDVDRVYMYGLKPAEKKLAQGFLDRVQGYYDSLPDNRVKLKLSKRLYQ